MISPRTARQTLDGAVAQLTAAGVDGAPQDAQRLLGQLLQMSPARLLITLDDPLDDRLAMEFDDLLARRVAREPMSHILGSRAFWKHEFLVTADVLDPRPDTETLIELALAEPFSEILDLGTGSGCIPISLLADRPGATGIATDISEAALHVAARNAEKLGVSDRLRFERSDWFEAVGGTYDLITSNPPYIDAAVYETLSPEVHHEPKIALTPGPDGLTPYRVFAQEGPAHLAPCGRILVEIGYDQGPQVAALFREAGLEDVIVHPDLNGKDRVVSARKG